MRLRGDLDAAEPTDRGGDAQRDRLRADRLAALVGGVLAGAVLLRLPVADRQRLAVAEHLLGMRLREQRARARERARRRQRTAGDHEHRRRRADEHDRRPDKTQPLHHDLHPSLDARRETILPRPHARCKPRGLSHRHSRASSEPASISRGGEGKPMPLNNIPGPRPSSATKQPGSASRTATGNTSPGHHQKMPKPATLGSEELPGYGLRQRDSPSPARRCQPGGASTTLRWPRLRCEWLSSWARASVDLPLQLLPFGDDPFEPAGVDGVRVEGDLLGRRHQRRVACSWRRGARSMNGSNRCAFGVGRSLIGAALLRERESDAREADRPGGSRCSG